jgi:AcrR family transcriptional regulator
MYVAASGNLTAPATPQFRTQELLLEPFDYLGTPRLNRQPSGRSPEPAWFSCHDRKHRADFADVKKKSASAGLTRRIRRAASDMRAQALAAARRLIVEGSDDVLTMRAVADAAGVTYPNLSHHFGSAAGLHAAIAEDLVRELLTGLQTVDVEMSNLEHDYRAVVDRVFDLFSENGLGRVLGWLVRSGETSRLEPVNLMLAEFIASRARPRSKTDSKRIARVALILAFAAYAESSVGPLLGSVLGPGAALRRDYFAQALAALREK